MLLASLDRVLLRFVLEQIEQWSVGLCEGRCWGWPPVIPRPLPQALPRGTPLTSHSHSHNRDRDRDRRSPPSSPSHLRLIGVSPASRFTSHLSPDIPLTSHESRVTKCCADQGLCTLHTHVHNPEMTLLFAHLVVDLAPQLADLAPQLAADRTTPIGHLADLNSPASTRDHLAGLLVLFASRRRPPRRPPR